MKKEFALEEGEEAVRKAYPRLKKMNFNSEYGIPGEGHDKRYFLTHDT